MNSFRERKLHLDTPLSIGSFTSDKAKDQDGHKANSQNTMSNPFTASSQGGKTIEPPPAGLHSAILTALYDVGWQYDEKFDKSTRKMIFRFELPSLPRLKGETKEGIPFDLPRALTKKYTNSLHEKAQLRAMLESWAGRPLTTEEIKSFDLTKLLGRACTIQVMHETKKDGNVRADVRTVLKLVGPKPTTTTTPVMWSITQIKTAAELDKADLPHWIIDLAKQSDEYRKLSGRPRATQEPSQAQPDAAPDSDPFAGEAPRTPATRTVQQAPAFDVPESDDSDSMPF